LQAIAGRWQLQVLMVQVTQQEAAADKLDTQQSQLHT
jgi:hypothetical protein